MGELSYSVLGWPHTVHVSEADFLGGLPGRNFDHTVLMFHCEKCKYTKHML